MFICLDVYIIYGSLAQLVEQIPLKDKVLGSIPRRPTTYKKQLALVV